MTLPPHAEHPGAVALVQSVIPDAVAVLNTIGDPVVRARAAGQAVEAATELRGELARVRQVAFSTVRARGASWAQLGEIFNVSATRAKQITTGER